MNEFELIKTLFAPLATAPGAFGLSDDAAVFSAPEGFEAVLTKDVMIEGVHFLGTAPADRVAQKLLRVNLSDLAAMGADPKGYLLGCQFKGDIGEDWLRAFVAGLAADQERFDVSLLGGDTTQTTGPMAFSLTAIGQLPSGTALRRSGARAGDDVWVSGTIGDGVLGLAVAQGRYTPDAEDAAYLRERLELPTPRLGLGTALRGVASAAVDVSDGLAADVGHLAEASKVAITLETDLVPLSGPAKTALAAEAATFADLICGGDDFELAFTAPKAARERIEALGADVSVPLSRIGHVEAGNPGVTVVEGGKPLALPQAGYRHF